MIQRCDLQWKMLGLGVVLLRHISARIKQPVYSAEYYIRPAIPPIWLWIGCYVSALPSAASGRMEVALWQFNVHQSESNRACQTGKYIAGYVKPTKKLDIYHGYLDNIVMHRICGVSKCEVIQINQVIITGDYNIPYGQLYKGPSDEQ